MNNKALAFKKMAFWPSGLSRRIMVVMLLLFVALITAVMSFWVLETVPSLHRQEQAKADLLMLASTMPIEQALAANKLSAVQAYIDQLLLLEEPATGDRLIDGVEIQTMDAEILSSWQASRSEHPFVSETILFSQDEERSILGSATLHYSSMFLENREEQGQQLLLAITAFFVLLLLVVMSCLEYLLYPLKYLARILRQTNTKTQYILPEMPVASSEEIMLVKEAMDVLLDKAQSNRTALEERVTERTIELKHATEVAESANRSKSDFLANMSHEIRTPMNAIVGLTGIALKMQLPPKLEDYLLTIKSSSDSLLRVINDILDFSKIEADKLDIEAIDFQLHDLLDDVCEMFRESAAAKDIELLASIRPGTPHTWVGDPHRLKQVLTNLVGNAIKFTEKGEVLIQVEVVTSDQAFASVKFSVWDTGMGVDPEKVDDLFEVFTQADTTTTRKFGGTGLGLAISRRLVEMMGGELDVDSRTEGGSCFYFTCKLGVQQIAAKSYDVCPSKLQGLKILVVDDNESARLVIREVLTSLTFEVTTVASGEQALEMLSQADFDCQMVMLDWKMPGLNGFEVLKRIRSLASCKDVPVVMMTAFGDDDVMKSAKKEGANAFLIKPLRQSVLYNAIIKVFADKDDSYVPIAESVQWKNVADDSLAGIEVLLVEDNKINQKVATEVLEAVGVVVDIANHGRDAIDCVQQKKYDAVLMDIQMPEMGGFEATDIIRHTLKMKDLPIIAMTANAMMGDREDCLAEGMNDYISKPIDVDVLYQVLQKWVKKDVDISSVTSVDQQQKVSQVTNTVVVLDYNRAVKGMGGDVSLMREVLADFVDIYGDAADQIEKMLAQGERDAAERLAHTLTGLAGTFRAKALRQSALDLELALRNDTGEIHNRLLATLRPEIEKVIIYIEQLPQLPVDEHQYHDGGDIDQSIITPIMHQLADLLLNQDYAADSCLSHLINTSGYGDRLQPMKKYLNHFEFDNAYQELHAIADEWDIMMQGEKA